MFKALPTVLVLIVALAGANACQGFQVSLAVKRGQKSVDRGELPFVCLGIGFKNAAFPLESVTLEDTKTHRDATVWLTKFTHNDHPDYLTARSAENESWSLLILRLPPGVYRVVKLQCDVPELPLGTLTLPFESEDTQYYFSVVPQVVTYVGSLLVSAAWKSIPVYRDALRGKEVHESFASQTTIKQTQRRDIVWVYDVVPGLRKVPSVLSAITVHP